MNIGDKIGELRIVRFLSDTEAECKCSCGSLELRAIKSLEVAFINSHRAACRICRTTNFRAIAKQTQEKARAIRNASKKS